MNLVVLNGNSNIEINYAIIYDNTFAIAIAQYERSLTKYNFIFQISQNGISQQVAAIPVSAISSTQLSQVLNAAGTATGHIAIPLTPATAVAARKAVVAKSQGVTATAK